MCISYSWHIPNTRLEGFCVLLPQSTALSGKTHKKRSHTYPYYLKSQINQNIIKNLYLILAKIHYWKKYIFKFNDPKFDQTRNLTDPKENMTKKEPDLARPGPRQPEIWDYLISYDLKPDPIRTRMIQNPRWPKLISIRNLTRSDPKWLETRKNR
jgi:hypothetical protein